MRSAVEAAHHALGHRQREVGVIFDDDWRTVPKLQGDFLEAGTAHDVAPDRRAPRKRDLGGPWVSHEPIPHGTAVAEDEVQRPRRQPGFRKNLS
jgi:hypothetical protein